MQLNAACCPSPPTLPSPSFLLNAACSSCPFILLLLHAGLSESRSYTGAKPSPATKRVMLRHPTRLPALFSQAGPQARLGAQPVATAGSGQGSRWGLILRWKDPGSPEVSGQLCSSRSSEVFMMLFQFFLQFENMNKDNVSRNRLHFGAFEDQQHWRGSTGRAWFLLLLGHPAQRHRPAHAAECPTRIPGYLTAHDIFCPAPLSVPRQTCQHPAPTSSKGRDLTVTPSCTKTQ